MRFSDIYARSGPVFSLEFFPPKDPNQLPEMLDLVKRLALDLSPNFMTVTYGAGGGTRELTRAITSFIAGDIKVPAVAHLTCIGQVATEIDSLLDQYESSGVRHILALRGDPPAGSAFKAPRGGFGCARDLASHIRLRGGFSIAVAGYPEGHPDAPSSESEIKYLKEKVDAGGEVILTQLFFDPELYLRFRDKCQMAGITVPIIPGIMPISNVKQLKRFTSLCGATVPTKILSDLESLENDPCAVRQYGSQWAIHQCKTLLKEGAPGLHFYTLNRSEQVETVIKELR